jgi:MazG family protein
MAAEAGHFDFDDVARGICDKMVRRHPHVFGDAEMDGSAAQTKAWEEHKAAERAEKAGGKAAGALDGVPLGLPALTRAEKLQRRAARVGFDWAEPGPVLAKIEEEAGELRQALAEGDGAGVVEEMGDVLFAYTNLARHLGVDAEDALRTSNAKFERRFRRVEALLAEDGRGPDDADLEEMDKMWNRAKQEEAK